MSRKRRSGAFSPSSLRSGACPEAVRRHKVRVSDQQLRRVRRACSALPGTTERVSHGEPTFFVHGKVYAMFANDHHHDGHIAVWIPAPPGFQAGLIKASPRTFFKPPYVGGRGWVGIELSRIKDDALRFHLHMAWELVAPKRLRTDPAAARLSKPSTPRRK